mgnify:FL=1
MLRSGCAALRNCGGKVADKANGWDATPGKGLSGLFSVRAAALRTPHRITGIFIICKCIESKGAFAYNNGYAHKKDRRKTASSQKELRASTVRWCVSGGCPHRHQPPPRRMRPPAATGAIRSRAHTSRKTIYGGCCRACNHPRGKRHLRAALRPACGAGCARRGGSFAPAGAGKGYAACGRDGHTGEHPARVKCTACGGSCLMISGAARAGHGDATTCGRSPTTHTPPKERTIP